MKGKNIKTMTVLGILCMLFVLASVWYSVTFNDGRLVYPTDFSTYGFIFQDIPMIAAIMAVTVYVLWIFVYIIGIIIRKKQEVLVSKRTRVLNPKLGWLGLFGFLGFAGFWTYSMDKTIFPFCFFMFWGFFGFFFEGKMSGTFMDERFKQNYEKAQLMSLKIGFGIIFITLLLFGQGRFVESLDYTAIILIIVISTTLGLTMFISEYLLYRYDHDELNEE